jgi:hypothetical protein
MRRNLEEAAKRNVGNTVVLARLFNEVQAQKMPNRMVRLILSEYLSSLKHSSHLRARQKKRAAFREKKTARN